MDPRETIGGLYFVWFVVAVITVFVGAFSNQAYYHTEEENLKNKRVRKYAIIFGCIWITPVLFRIWCAIAFG